MKIALDVFGGDNSPHEHIKGAVEALKQDSDLQVVLVGNAEVINSHLLDANDVKARIEIVNATEVVTNDDNPTEVLRSKKDSSMVRALEITKNRDDICGMVTTGNTGAALTGATLIVGRLPGIRRAALSPLLPTFTGGKVCLIDAGANAESQPEFLEQFAKMGSEYMKAVCGVKNPRVALVSNGTEDKKGNALVQAAFPLLKNLDINFVGNMETTKALSGDYDVLVCDGFVGNILLKSIEGTVKGLMVLLKTALKSTVRAKIGGLFARKALRKAFKPMSADDLGAAAFIGCKKLVAKAHGNSTSKEIRAALLQVKKMHEAKLIEKLAARD